MTTTDNTLRYIISELPFQLSDHQAILIRDFVGLANKVDLDNTSHMSLCFGVSDAQFCALSKRVDIAQEGVTVTYRRWWITWDRTLYDFRVEPERLKTA
jgi:hypothetical protein